MGPTNEEEATSKKAISIEINNKNRKKKKKRSQLPPPDINWRNSYPLLRREKKDTTITSSCSCSRVQETVIEDERIVVQQISNLSLDTKLNHHHRQRRIVHDVISSAADDVAITREASTPKKLKIRLIKGGEETRRDCNYNDNYQLVESKCEEGIVDTTTSNSPIVKEGGRCDENVDDHLTSCLSGWKLKRRRSAGSSLELKEVVVETEFDSEMLEAAESLLMLRYGRPSSSSMVMVEEEDSRSNMNRKCLLSFDLNQPAPPTTPEDEQQHI